jgi:twitching motility protein PilT
VFPSHQQSQVRTQLSFTLEGVMSQQLLPAAAGRGRVMACEVLIATAGVRALIRDAKSHQIYSHIQTGGRVGMRTMAQNLAELVTKGRVNVLDAEMALSDPTELHTLIRAA